MIPESMREEAVAAYRDQEPILSIHRRLWPTGNPHVSPTMLQTILQALASVEEARERVAEAPDNLPTEMDGVETDLVEARDEIMKAIRGGGQGAGGEVGEDESAGCNPMYFAMLANVVKVHVAVSKHRLELQKHRAAYGPRSARRGPTH